MNFWEFASGSPFLTFFLSVILMNTLVGIMESIFRKKK